MNPSRILAPVLLAFTIALAGCGGTSPVQERAQSVEVAARVLEAGASSIEEAAYQDAARSCPDAAPECLETVRVAWEPVDAALALATTGLEIWLAGGTGEAFATAWVDLIRLARSFGFEL